MYKPICQEENLILGDGSTVIVTGWTPKEKIASKIDKAKYAAIGQLYDGKGIHFLLRNILANPCVDRIVLLLASNLDQTANNPPALFDALWQEEDMTFVPEELQEHIPTLRSSIVYQVFSEVDQCVEHVSNCLPLPKELTHREVTILPPKPPKAADLVPSSMHGHCIKSDNIADAWVQVVKRVMDHGGQKPSQYGSVRQELIDVVAVVTDEDWDCDIPSWLPFDRRSYSDYKHQLMDGSQIENSHYSYGNRMREWFDVDQLKGVVEKLKEDKNSNQAVVNLWDSAGDINCQAPPCLNHLRFYVYDGELHLTVTFRSHDIFKAWCLNAMGLRWVQQCISLEIQLPIGKLTVISQSAHVYSDDWQNARQLIQEQMPRICNAHKKRYSDPVGNFIVRWREPKVYVEQQDTDGNFIRSYSNKKPLKVLREIVESNPSIDPFHAAYIGSEVMKAVLYEEEYIQDK